MIDSVAALLASDNAWSLRVRDRLNALPPELVALVLHLGTTPEWWNHRHAVNGEWKRQVKAHLKTTGADSLVRDAVRELARDGSFHEETPQVLAHRADSPLDPRTRAAVRARTKGLAVGFLLAAGQLRADDGVGVDLALVGRKNSQAMDTWYLPDNALAGAAFTALGDLAGPDAMEHLWVLYSAVPTSTPARPTLVRAVKRAAKRRRIPADGLAERTVPRHGLGPDGALRMAPPGTGAEWINTWTDTLVTLGADGRVTLTWLDAADGPVPTRAPFPLPRHYAKSGLTDSITIARNVARRIEATADEETRRLTDPAMTTRSWPWGEWVRYYRDHPITGIVTRRLNWQYLLPGETAPRPLDPRTPIDALPADAEVTLVSTRLAAAGAPGLAPTDRAVG
ncbi:hypothetical protein [Streptomyces sp. R33]|uniref:DUF4132 domain-containing protein n=1 Tax=Streptomyces sp. R33 TaxID=3238629 RepID=A0AB39XYR1_9ACTN